MLKQRVVWASVALMLGLAWSSQANIVIGDFEKDMGLWGQTWENNITLALSPTGATSGAQSLAVKLNTGGYWSLQWNALTTPKLVAGTKLQFDLTMIQSEWTGNNWTKVADKLALNSNGKSGWKEYFPKAVDKATGADTAGDWGPWNPDVTKTFSVDISDYDATGATWFQINISLQQNPATGNGNFYFDNVQLVGIDGAKVVWVTFHAADDKPSAGAAGAGFTVAPDKAYTDLLAKAGYNVVRFVQTGTPDVNALNAANLVIAGRSVASGSFQNAASTTWNAAVTAPTIIMNGYLSRKSRLGYYTGSTIPDSTGDIKLKATDPNHPIFAGIPMTAGDMNNVFAGIVTYPDGKTIARGISIVTEPINADGKLIATVSAASAATGPAGAAMIAEWKAGAKVTHDGGAGTDTLGGRRLVFLSGSRETSGVNSETAGQYDLAADGTKLFLNAVAYMLTPPAAPVAVPLVNASFEEPNTVKIKGWNGEGVGGTPAVDVPGWASDGVVADSGVETGFGATDGKWTAFVKDKDPMVFQVTDYAIKAGDTFTLKFDARNTWQATKMTAILFYDETGMQIPLASQDFAMTDAMTTCTMTFTVAGPDGIGNKVGIAFANSTGRADASAWMGMDNVRLTVLAK